MAKKKKESVRIKEETRTLNYVFTDKEQIENGKRMCELVSKVTRLEEEKKAVSQDYGNKITLAKTELHEASTKVGNGYEFRSIKCKVIMNKPEIGMKTILRTDYEENDIRSLVGEEKMTSAEMQEEIDFKEDAENVFELKEGADDERED